MHKLLIPLLVCLTATLVHAQVPTIVNFSSKPVPATSTANQPDGACSAGTFTLGQFIGKSNDHDLDTIYLCLGDSIQLQHNGDQVFMDPDPTTAPGIGYSLYQCPPTATGDEITVKGDPCLWPGAANGFWAVTSSMAGSPWFYNSGALHNSATFCNGVPCLITYAPITITGWPSTLEPGCIDVDTGAAFSVVYLKAIAESGVSVNFSDDCKGKFRLRGGYPEWDNSGTYTVSITLASDPTVKALIYTPPAQMKHGNDIIFSVPQSGVYNVLVVDGKSCDHMFQINMNVCNPSNNVSVILPEVVSPPGSHVCVPITLNNFTDIFGTSFSLSWDPTILIYDSIHNANPAFGVFDAANNLNTQNVSLGNLGILYFDNSFPPKGVTIPSGQTMVEVCFTVVGPLGSCTPLDVVSFPTLVTMDNIQGQSLAVTVDTGQVCADFVPLKVQFGVAPPGCADASLSVIIEGGTGPYQITWTNQATGAAGVTFANLPDTILTLPQAEGIYTVCVSDDNGNGTQICDTVTIDIPSLGATLVLVQSPTCNGAMDGSIRADVSVDGVILPFPVGPSFTFAWSPATLPAAQEQNGIKAGPYIVTVTDPSTGCTALASGSLTEPAALNASNIQITPASCSGVADGSISVTVNGGTAFANNEYFFSWEYTPEPGGTHFTDESGSANPFTMTNKPAGFYFLTITDANGCTHTEEVEITNARAVTVNKLNIVNPTCAGLCNGSVEAQINAQPAFNNPNYLFFWTSVPTGGCPFTAVNNGNSSVLSGLQAKQYQVLVLETTTGCSDTATFVLTDPLPLDVTATPTDPTCLAPTSGSAKAVSTGGTGPAFTYTWGSNPPVVIPPGANATGLAAGTYTVTVQDANGCRDSATINLKLPPPPAFTAVDSSSVKCGSDGSLTVTAPTATSFTWTTLAGGNTIGQTATVTGLPGDTYVITIKDAKGCVNMDTFTLAAVVPMSFLDTSFIEPTCFGGMDGTVAIQVQNGNPAPGNTYQYNWSSGQNTPILFGIKAGTYTVTVTDLKLCTLVGKFVLHNPPSINVSSSVTQFRVSCPGLCDGAVQLTVSYIDSSQTSIPGTFNYAWSDNGPTDSIRTNLCAGVTSVTVTDNNNCSYETLVSIDSLPALTATIDTIPVTCYGGSDGEAIAAAAGGNGAPFTYLWDTGSTLAHVTGLSALMDHTVVITDKNNCKDTIIVKVPQPDSIQITKAEDNIDCFGGNTGGITLTVSGGNPGAYTFNWSDQNNNNLGDQNPLTNLSAGAYSVTVTDMKGCTAELLNIPLSDPPAVQGTILPWEELLCHGDETTLNIDSIFGGSGAPYQYSLDFGVYLDKDFPVTMGGGEHYVTFIDRLGCEYTDTIFVTEPDPISVTFDSLEVEIELGDSIQLIPIVTGAVVDSFTWSPPEFLSNPDTLEPYTLTFGSQLYTIVVFDEKGCSATGSIRVNVDPNRNVYVPNAFIPGNPKGIDDHFNPLIGRGVEIVNYLRVFDRWGNLMYERNTFLPDNNDFAEGWDGKYRGQYVMPGVYVYAIEVKFLDNRVLLYRGDVTVIR